MQPDNIDNMGDEVDEVAVLTLLDVDDVVDVEAGNFFFTFILFSSLYLKLAECFASFNYSSENI